MNLVIGATGILGNSICQLLAGAGKPVTALARPTSDPARVEALKQASVAIVHGDLKDRASLEAACKGVKTVISTASATLSRQPGDSIHTVDLEGQLSLVDAARAAGVERFIFISFRSEGDYPLIAAKRAVEQRIKESGMAYTILQPTFFTEVWLSPGLGFDAAAAKARIFGAGTGKNHWISFEDVARFAAGAVDNPGAKNAVFEVGGPEALSALEVVRLFEEIGGRPFQLEHVPEEALRAQRDGAGDPMERSFAGLMSSCALGRAVDSSAALAAIPVTRTSVRAHAERVLSAT